MKNSSWGSSQLPSFHIPFEWWEPYKVYLRYLNFSFQTYFQTYEIFQTIHCFSRSLISFVRSVGHTPGQHLLQISMLNLYQHRFQMKRWVQWMFFVSAICYKPFKGHYYKFFNNNTCGCGYGPRSSQIKLSIVQNAFFTQITQESIDWRIRPISCEVKISNDWKFNLINSNMKVEEESIAVWLDFKWNLPTNFRLGLKDDFLIFQGLREALTSCNCWKFSAGTRVYPSPIQGVCDVIAVKLLGCSNEG